MHGTESEWMSYYFNSRTSCRIHLQEVPIIKLAREVVRDFVPRAMDKRIDLGYEGEIRTTMEKAEGPSRGLVSSAHDIDDISEHGTGGGQCSGAQAGEQGGSGGA